MNYKGIELDQIVLIPGEKGSYIEPGQVKFTISDPVEGRESLPIFTSPNDTVTGLKSVKAFSEAGFMPVLPLSLPIQDRLEWIETCFVSFTPQEIMTYFIQSQRPGSGVFKICLETGAMGNCADIVDLGGRLKSLYRGQIAIMGGNCGSSKTYLLYCKAGFDYVRVGVGIGSLVDHEINPVRTPAGTLLLDIKSIKGSATAGLKEPKVILDGGISGITDIPKALALGADYVMLGKELAGLVEAEGEIYVTESGPGKGKLLPISEEERTSLPGLPEYEIKEGEYFRYYSGIFSPESAEKISGSLGYFVPDGKVEALQLSGTLKTWTDRFYQIMFLSMQTMGTPDLDTFRSNAKYQILGYDGE